jgi:hypothetical protein
VSPQQPIVAAVGTMRSLALWAGKRIVAFTGRSLFGTSKNNEVLAAFNAFLNPQVTKGSPQISISDAGWALRLPDAGDDSSGGGNMSYRGLYSGATDYALNDVVYVGATPPVRFSYVCESINGPATAVHAPDPTETGTIYWRLVAGV